MISRGSLHHFLIVAHTILGVMVISTLESAGIAGLNCVYPERLIVGESAVEYSLIFRNIAACLIVGPKFYAIGCCIACYGVDVEVGIGFYIVEMLVTAPVLPTFIPALEEYTLYIVGLGKVNV